MLELLKTLLEWRLHEEPTTPFWELLRPFFEQHGYILWKDEHGFAKPRDYPDAIRAQDDYHNWADFIGTSESSMPIEVTIRPARARERAHPFSRRSLRRGRLSSLPEPTSARTS